jgi:hypothetical protein
MKEETAVTTVTNALEVAVASVVAIAKRHGLHQVPDVSYQIEWMEPEDETRAVGKHRELSQQSYSLWYFEHRAEIDGDPGVQRLNTIAKEAFETKGKKLQFIGTNERLGLVLLNAYFEEVRRFELSKEAAARISQMFISDIVAETAIASATFRVRSFSTNDPFELEGGISFRPIAERDIRIYGRTDDVFRFTKGLMIPQLDSRDWICTIERSVRKDDLTEFNYMDQIIEDVATAFALTTPGRTSFLLLDKSIRSPFLHFGRTVGGAEVLTTRAGYATSLTSEDIARLRKIFALVQRAKNDNTLRYLQLPLRRLRVSTTRQNEEDHFVDCIIGLERLLAHDTDKLEATFRFRLRGAALLSDAYGNARDRYRLMSQLYGTRSRVVHGGVTSGTLAASVQRQRRSCETFCFGT